MAAVGDTMNRQNNCYVNNAYSGYYDNSCEDDDLSVTSSENNSNADDNEIELEISDDNETFVDEDYYRHNNIDNRSIRLPEVLTISHISLKLINTRAFFLTRCSHSFQRHLV